MLKMNSLTTALMLVAVIALTCLAGCGGGNDSHQQPNIVQVKYLSGGLVLNPDATSKIAVAMSTPIMITPCIMETAGGDGHNYQVEVKNNLGQVETPYDKETWMLFRNEEHTIRLKDGNRYLPGIQKLEVVNPLSQFGSPYLSINQFGYEQNAHFSGFWLVEPGNQVSLWVLQRPVPGQMITQGGPLPADVKVYNLDHQVVATGEAWIPTPGYFHIVAATNGATYDHWVYSSYGKG